MKWHTVSASVSGRLPTAVMKLSTRAVRWGSGTAFTRSRKSWKVWSEQVLTRTRREAITFQAVFIDVLLHAGVLRSTPGFPGLHVQAIQHSRESQDRCVEKV